MNRVRQLALTPVQVLHQRNPSAVIAVSVGLAYAVFGGLWIEFSSNLVADVATSTQELVLLERFKGLGFVVIMTLMVTVLTYGIHRHARHARQFQARRRRDPITGLMNRSMAMAIIRDRLVETSGSTVTNGIVLLDIYQLRRINHALGRSGGDAVIRLVGQRLNDIAEGRHLVARLENDSFLLGLPAGLGEEEMVEFARQVLAGFRIPVDVGGQEVKIDLYGGLAYAPKHGNTASELVDAAMRARDRCRAQGRDICVARQEDTLGSKAILEFESELRRAIQHHEFSLVFQPQIDLEHFDIAGCEALVRWRHPTRGLVSPGAFIPLAESLRLIPAITRQVIEDAVATWAGWRVQGLRELPMSVNLSPLDLEDDRLVDFIRVVLARHHMPGRYLTLEITEGWLMDDPQRALGILEQLSGLGVRVAIDDFGTGYSSLSQMMRFPVDEVKIDRAFVAGADADVKKRAILEAIEHMAGALGAHTIAEGAETFGELVVLKRIGFSQVQGFVVAAPLPGDVYAQSYLQPGHLPEFEATRRTLAKLTRSSPDASPGDRPTQPVPDLRA